MSTLYLPCDSCGIDTRTLGSNNHIENGYECMVIKDLFEVITHMAKNNTRIAGDGGKVGVVMSALQQWDELVARVNGRSLFGHRGVRDPDFPCAEYDGLGYDGSGKCLSDGHYECQNCSHLAPNAPRFESEGGRADRLRLFWRRHQGSTQ